MDKVKELATKLKALADRGVGGEQVNATQHLHRLLDKYGLTIAGIEGEAKSLRRFQMKGRRVDFMSQVILSVMGDCQIYATYKSGGGGRSRIIALSVECTDAEYIEISERQDFYWEAFQKDLELFYSAFIQKNKLYKKPLEGRERKQMSPEEINRMMKVMSMMDGMEQHTHRKKLQEAQGNV